MRRAMQIDHPPDRAHPGVEDAAFLIHVSLESHDNGELDAFFEC